MLPVLAYIIIFFLDQARNQQSMTMAYFSKDDNKKVVKKFNNQPLQQLIYGRLTDVIFFTFNWLIVVFFKKQKIFRNLRHWQFFDNSPPITIQQTQQSSTNILFNESGRP